jgi:type IV secretion system protein VirB8
MSSDTLKQYLDEAASWDADRIALSAQSMRRAWWVAAGAGTCAVFSCAALLALMPLKRVEPFVVRVDNATGVVDVVPMYSGNTDIPQTVTRYFLNHYVTVCERFNYATAESDYSECGAFHSAPMNQQWAAAWDRGNPESPLNVHKDGSTVSAQVTAITFFTRASGTSDLAQVRYVKSRRMANAVGEQRSYWVATVQYVYGPPSKNPNVRRWNPLGLKIVEFRREAEAMSAPEASSVARGAP